MTLKAKVIIKFTTALIIGSIGFALVVQGEGGFAFSLLAGWLFCSATRDMDKEPSE